MFQSKENKPLAIQCLWNSDYEYIGLNIAIVFKKKGSFSAKEIVELEYKNFDSSEAMVIEARKIASQYVDKYGIELYFPSPDNWSRDCPNWWDYKTSPKCEDCKTPIIPTTSVYLPKEVCYPCHLRRETNKSIIEAEPYDQGVQMYLSKNGEYEKIGYCTNFESFPISSFIKHVVESQTSTDKVINVVKLRKLEMLELNDNLKKALVEKLDNYTKPVITEQAKAFTRTHKVEFNGTEYELEYKFNQEHREIFDFINSLERNKKALDDDYSYEIYFKKGITHRDDAILRFINYIKKGKTDLLSINEHYDKILTEIEIAKTVEKLKRIGCIEILENEISITTTGKNIV
ncbi:hypothetical protein [Flavobacterium branchiicola]|uniref:Uncharacterized protein n=1 Tax=Flavobacterium branchiicola TaxID=1114875 RepID=A0ABV9PF91_9FLAO|nr:hypothetical protein [Flavobacterium branchiicola]MBS7253882.1 hypothetical protein [Flavobacterium branchiicola]